MGIYETAKTNENRRNLETAHGKYIFLTVLTAVHIKKLLMENHAQ